MKTASTPFLPILATMSLFACIAPSALADRAENAFVKVRAVGAGVTRVDGRNFSAQGDTEVEIEAQPGWTLLTPSRVRVTKGQSPRYRVKSVSNEDDGHGDIYWTTTEHILRHMEDPTVTADVSAGGPYVYAAPQDGTNAVLSCSASATPGMHVWETRTTVYKNGAVVSTSASNSDPFPLELDQWSWEWSLGPENGTTNVQSFSTEPIHLSCGTYPAEGTVTASSSQCNACHASTSSSNTARIGKLSVAGFTKSPAWARGTTCSLDKHQTTCTGSVSPAGISDVVYSIQGDAHGATIDASSGLISPGRNQSGEIIVRVAAAIDSSCFVTTNLLIHAIPTGIVSTTHSTNSLHYGAWFAHKVASSGGDIEGIKCTEIVSVSRDDFGTGFPGATEGAFVEAIFPNRILLDKIETPDSFIHLSDFVPSPPKRGLPAVLETPQVLEWKCEEDDKWVPFVNVSIVVSLEQRPEGFFVVTTDNGDSFVESY